MTTGRRGFVTGFAAVALAAMAGPGRAQQPPDPGPMPEVNLGQATGQPLPRWVSLKSGQANVRRGPSLNHRIDWVFQHPGTPLLVTAEFGNWRRVRDHEGAGGWIHHALLSTQRTVIVTVHNAPVRDRPQPDANLVAMAERGAIARLRRAQDGFVQIDAARQVGWISINDIWGSERDAAG